MTTRKPAPELDAIDRKLMASLRENSRLPVSQLATMLDIPRTQVYARLERLEAEGIIDGYTVRLGQAYSKSRLRAHVMIKTLPMEQWAIAREMRERIKARFDHEGIEMALPQRVVWHRDPTIVDPDPVEPTPAE